VRLRDPGLEGICHINVRDIWGSSYPSRFNQ